MLAGVSEQTIYTRRKKNGGDIELAIAGDARGGKEMYETAEEFAEKQIIAELLAAEDRRKNAVPMRTSGGNADLQSLNALIDALESVGGMRFDREETRTKLGETLDELKAMRNRMYGHLVDWGKVARDGHN